MTVIRFGNSAVIIISKKFVFALYLLTFIYQSQQKVDAAPYDNEAIIIIPFKASNEHVTKIKSFKIDGQAAVKEITSRVTAEKVIRTLANIPEFDILVEGLDAITLGDVYKAAFPHGILQSIGEQYLPTPAVKNHKAVIVKPDTVESAKTTDNVDVESADVGVANETYDEVHEDDVSQGSNEELKEEPITDDYVYDQPIEDRFDGDREYITGENDKSENIEDDRDSTKLILEKNRSEVIINENRTNKELEKYGATFRNWITRLLTG